jgi:hypothetical protein
MSLRKVLRRCISVTFAAFLVLSPSMHLFLVSIAASTMLIPIPFSENGVGLDGQLTQREWFDAYSFSTQSASGAGQNQYWVKYMPKDNGIFMAANITDSTFDPGDSLILSIDKQNDNTSVPNSDDYQFWVNRGSSWRYSQGNGESWQLQDFGFSATSTNGWEFAVHDGGSFWTLEMVVYTTPQNDNQTIGFQIMQYDSDSGTSVTFPSGSDINNPATWARARFQMLPSTLSLSLSSTGVQRNQNVNITTYDRFSEPDGTVGVFSSNNNGASWTSLAKLNGTRVSFFWAPTQSGIYMVKANWTGDSIYRIASSNISTIPVSSDLVSRSTNSTASPTNGIPSNAWGIAFLFSLPITMILVGLALVLLGRGRRQSFTYRPNSFKDK